MKRVGEGVYRGRVGTAGRVVLAQELRKKLGIDTGDWVRVQVTADGLLVTVDRPATGKDSKKGET